MVDGDPEKSRSKGGPRERSPVHAGQTGHTGDPGVPRDARVLLPDLPGCQGIGRLEADPQPQGFQQVCSAPILSDGDTANSHGLPRGGSSTKTEQLRTFEGLKSVRNVGDLYRFKSCLFSCGRGARAHQIPPLCLQRQSLQVSGAPLRSVDGSLLASTAQPAKTWQRFLGHLTSLRELVPMAVVHTRPIQLMLHDQ